jgi:hypothetical protein
VQGNAGAERGAARCAAPHAQQARAARCGSWPRSSLLPAPRSACAPGRTLVLRPFWCPMNMKVLPSMLPRPHTMAGSSRPPRSPCSSTNYGGWGAARTQVGSLQRVAMTVGGRSSGLPPRRVPHESVGACPRSNDSGGAAGCHPQSVQRGSGGRPGAKGADRRRSLPAPCCGLGACSSCPRALRQLPAAAAPCL